MRKLTAFAPYVLIVGGLLLAYLELLPSMVGFSSLLLGFVISLVALPVSLALFLFKKDRSFLLVSKAAAPIVLVFVGILLSRGEAPPFNDVSTDLDNPPQFISTPKGLEDLNTKYSPEIKLIIKETYPALMPLNWSYPCHRVQEELEKLLQSIPSVNVTELQRESFRLQFQQKSKIFKFVDDVVIELRDKESDQCQMNIRSRSRDGRSDLGANERRIRSIETLLLARLK